MQLDGFIFSLSKELKYLIATFIIVLSIGFYTGLLFVKETSSVNAQGIEEQYLGNEDKEVVAEMKFKKTDKQMLNIVHSHILSMSLIFFLVGAILSLTKLNKKLKLFLMVEPFISVVLTFGGIYLLWTGMTWMKYVIIFSGTIMTLTYTASVLVILSQLFKKVK